MLKLTGTALAVVLASSASGAGWRSLTLDGTDEASFTKSVAAIQEKLSAARRLVFDAALQDLWVLGQQDADDAQREFTASEYFQKLDGLGYEEIVALMGPNGETAEQRYMAAAIRYSARDRTDSLRTLAASFTPESTEPRFYPSPQDAWDPSK